MLWRLFTALILLLSAHPGSTPRDKTPRRYLVLPMCRWTFLKMKNHRISGWYMILISPLSGILPILNTRQAGRKCRRILDWLYRIYRKYQKHSASPTFGWMGLRRMILLAHLPKRLRQRV